MGSSRAGSDPAKLEEAEDPSGAYRPMPGPF